MRKADVLKAVADVFYHGAATHEETYGADYFTDEQWDEIMEAFHEMYWDAMHEADRTIAEQNRLAEL